jgi:ribosome-binding factor A
VLDDAEKERTVRKLNSMISFFKGELGKRLRMKFIPIPVFKIDESIEYGRKIDGIFDDINSDRGPVDDDEDLF